ncbi:MAG: hypothetical protein J6A41_02875 [Ruminiclostridium sp.]|nr:hypothetical protein [Ruminiclostridium sp.]
MGVFNRTAMISLLDQVVFQGEKYQYPVYGVIKNTSFFATAYNQHRGCYLAISEFRRLLFVECNALTGAPIRMGALVFEDLVSSKIKKASFGQYKIVLEFMVDGKKKKFTFRIAKKVYGTDFDEQEYNCEGIVSELKKICSNRK